MRALLERISPVLLVAVTAGGFVAMSALPAAAQPSSDRLDHLHSERPIAANSVLAPSVVTPEEQLALEAEQAAQTQRDVDAYLAMVAEATPAQSHWSGSAASAPSRGACGDDVSCFLACTRAHESDSAGGYGAVSSSGTYHGAYQFNQATWDAAVAGAGHDEYVGVPADQVPAGVQDAAAVQLYSASGNSPWGGRC